VKIAAAGSTARRSTPPWPIHLAARITVDFGATDSFDTDPVRMRYFFAPAAALSTVARAPSTLHHRPCEAPRPDLVRRHSPSTGPLTHSGSPRPTAARISWSGDAAEPDRVCCCAMPLLRRQVGASLMSDLYFSLMSDR
jgi:hypothetical protein